MTKNEFQIGDVVKLKSESAAMVVINNTSNIHIGVCWMTKGGIIKKDNIHNEALKITSV